MKGTVLILMWTCLIGFGCSSKKDPNENDTSSTISVMKVDSIKILRDDSLVTILVDYNLYSKYHDEQTKTFNNWAYDSAYYLQRIKAQTQKSPVQKLTVPDELKKVWIPIYSIDSIFYVQKDNDSQFRFDINDSTLNFFDGMQPVEPYVINGIQKKANDFEIATRASEKIIFKRFRDGRRIYALRFKGNCAYVIPFSDFNQYPIIIANGKKGATTIEDWIDLDVIDLCN